MRGVGPSSNEQHQTKFVRMKIRQQATERESRELLLKEYFLNAYLIALLKQFGSGMRRRTDEENEEWAQRIAEQN